jgi:hypothetical protein
MFFLESPDDAAAFMMRNVNTVATVRAKRIKIRTVLAQQGGTGHSPPLLKLKSI